MFIGAVPKEVIEARSSAASAGSSAYNRQSMDPATILRDAEGQFGGLLVYPQDAPHDWGFKKFNSDSATILRYLESTGGTPLSVPYRAIDARQRARRATAARGKRVRARCSRRGAALLPRAVARIAKRRARAVSPDLREASPRSSSARKP
jgi:hypothetical protein